MRPPCAVNRVLIADNDRAVSGLLREVLERAGLRVEQAFDGEEARRMARVSGVACLVCDLDMPRANGIEVLESLRAVAAPPPVVVVSGYLDAEVRARLAELPFVREVMRKPFDVLRFSAKVQELAGGREGGSADRAASV